MNQFILYLINIFHVIIILFVVLSPFLNINFLLLLHAVVVPFIMLHWMANDNNCILTLIEKKIRMEISGTLPKNSDCFTCRLIEPIYDFKSKNQSSSKFIYIGTILLLLITLFKIGYKFKTGQIRYFTDFYK